MKLYGWFLGQQVTVAELADGFTAAEDGDHVRASDFGFGVMKGTPPTQRGAGANMSIDAPACSVYDKAGKRIRWSSTQNIDVSVDSANASTTVTTVGNSRKVSVFAKFKRALSNVRVDGNDDEVFYDQDESFEFVVVKGAEAVSPTLPALDATNILLCDITLAYGTTSVTNLLISTTRREKYSPQILGGTFQLTSASIAAQLAELHTVINTLGAVSGFAKLGGDGLIPKALIAQLGITDVQFYQQGTVHGGTAITTTSSATYVDTAALVTIPDAAAGDIILLIARTRTTGDVKLVVSEDGGANVDVSGTDGTRAGGISEPDLPWYVAHTVAVAGDVKFTVRMKSPSGSVVLKDAALVAVRLTP